MNCKPFLSHDRHILCQDKSAPLASKVVAVVGDEKITQCEVDDFARNIPQPFRDAFAAKALERLIDARVFSSAAIKEGLDKSPEFVARLEKERQRILADYFIEKHVKGQIKVSPSDST